MKCKEFERATLSHSRATVYGFAINTSHSQKVLEAL